jgi:hypothetical protein
VVREQSTADPAPLFPAASKHLLIAVTFNRSAASSKLRFSPIHVLIQECERFGHRKIEWQLNEMKTVCLAASFARAASTIRSSE